MFEADIVAYITEAPVIEVREGVVHVIDRSRNRRIERSMSIRSFEKYLARGKRALERYASGELEITEDG